ncbi:hypothetical protein F5Y18DRAFT_150393 [Xylariaceae sp. FL1019]|nr:hypothetical protein F5Y18DRAFT_150393 [Xylariaceae sp. FL1019]
MATMPLITGVRELPLVTGVHELPHDPTRPGTHGSYSLLQCCVKHPYAWDQFIIPGSIVNSKPHHQTRSRLLTMPTHLVFMMYDYMGPMELLCMALTCKTLLSHRNMLEDLKIPSLAIHRPILPWTLISDGDEEDEDQEMESSEEDNNYSDDYDVTDVTDVTSADVSVAECESFDCEDYDMDVSEDDVEMEEPKVLDSLEAIEDSQDMDVDACGAIFELLQLVAPNVRYP